MQKKDKIIIRGAKENNLKNLNLEIPKNKLVVFTGLSGSGKSSLAFNTIYEEGRRRYIDSLSSYARQFLGGTKKPKVDSIEGLSPSISIEQKTTHSNPRSTVGTVTEIHDYLRLLFSKVGKPFCPKHKIEISSQKQKDIIDKILAYPEDSNIMIMSPIAKGEKGTFAKTFEKLQQLGFLRVKVDGEILSLDNEILLSKNQRHDIWLIVDRVSVSHETRDRISEAITVAMNYSDGWVDIEDSNGEIEKFSQQYSCIYNDFQMPKIETKLFSFNSPYGMCDECKGLGVVLEPNFDLMVPNKKLSINLGALDKIPGISSKNKDGIEFQKIKAMANFFKFSLDDDIEDLSPEIIEILKHGSKVPITYSHLMKNSETTFERSVVIEGMLDRVSRLHIESTSEDVRNWLGRFMINTKCKSCSGKRLNQFSLAVKVGMLNIDEYSNLSIEEAFSKINELEFNIQEQEISEMIINELKNRLGFLINVGLEYLSLSRNASTLSGGESQRIRLATQIGSKLTGVLYVLDEPSIGLHQSDNEKLISTLKEMVDLGNTLIVVEHDEETIEAADWVVDIGPKAGNEGGKIIAEGTPDDIALNEKSITGQYLSKNKTISIPKYRRSGNGKVIEIKGAKKNNLNDVDVKIPLGKLNVVTGVSGSGKSTLVNEILLKSIQHHLNSSSTIKPNIKSASGLFNVDKVVQISQSPIGKTPRSNPATYTTVFDDIRDIFANATLSKARGYEKGRFSFNVPGGRCDKCQGDGTIKIEMQFLPNVYITCDHCEGKRYNYETLEVTYKNKNISDILNMKVSEALVFFENRSKIHEKIKTLSDVGLGYITLGQSATTLSGGEAQRIKLASYLQKRPTGKSIFILDEPTTGLHTYDVQNLLNIINKIVDNGDTVVVIEHNLDIIKNADYIIDLGPKGGSKGGKIIAKGTPEQIINSPDSITGKFLKKVMENENK